MAVSAGPETLIPYMDAGSWCREVRGAAINPTEHESRGEYTYSPRIDEQTPAEPQSYLSFVSSLISQRAHAECDPASGGLPFVGLSTN